MIYYMYNFSSACQVGTYLSDEVSVCLDCNADHYSEGGYSNSCNPCPSGAMVPAGVGFNESNCTYWGKFLYNIPLVTIKSELALYINVIY